MDDRVRFVGRVDDHVLRRWQRTAAVTVCLSRHEAYGLVLAEAVAAGSGVVASDIEAHREVASAIGGRVRLVHPDLPASDLAAAIEEARRESSEVWPEPSVTTWQEVAERTLALYDGRAVARGRAMTPARSGGGRPTHVCIVGSGMTFVSGISYFTYFLAAAFTERYETSVVLMRRLVPRRFYPGRDRVGAPISDLEVASICPTFDGVDWFALPSLLRAGRFLRHQRPDVVVFQWWTGAVVLSYLHLARVARRGGARVILEFHEDQDTGEASLPMVERIVRPGLCRLIRRADHFVVHSEWDRARLSDRFCLDPTEVSVIPVGPFDVGGDDETGPPIRSVDGEAGTDRTVTVLFFGTIRPYKGLEDLIDAFDLLPRGDELQWRLLVVGETWEGWDLPTRKIRASPFAGDIEFINRYVTDAEIPQLYARADIVALPYLRSSASGPLHLTMRRGLPVVITDVGGLREAARDYPGTVFVPAGDPRSLADGIVAGLDLRGVRHEGTGTWERSVELFSAAIDRPNSEEVDGRPFRGGLPGSDPSGRLSRAFH